MAIADGHISDGGDLRISHCGKQIEYLMWKRQLLIDAGVVVTPVSVRGRVTSRGTVTSECSFKVYRSRYLKLLRKVLYKPTKKIYRKNLLDKLSPLHLAIWFQDDGFIYNVKRKDGKIGKTYLGISTYCDENEAKVIQEYFKEKYGINFCISHDRRSNDIGYYLRTCSCGARKFISLVIPHITCGMLYKTKIFWG